jgi:hypothetical protein
LETTSEASFSSLCRPNIWSAKFHFIYSYVNVYLTCI